MNKIKIPKISEIVQEITFPKKEISVSDKIYIFGRNPELSLAELIARFNVIQSSPMIKDLSKNGAVIEADKHILIKNCGSILKKCKIIGIFPKEITISKIESVLESYISQEYIVDKSNWGISVYNEHFSYGSILNATILKEKTKKIFKGMGVKKVYFCPPIEGQILNPQKLKRKKIIEEGIELIIWYRKNSIILGQTEEIIDVDAFSKRDKERPHKRLLLLLGLALARTMVNLVSVEENNHKLSVYDPFCGMGSIIQEAYLLGLNAMGSDIDPSCVTRSRENLTWISQKQNKTFKIKFGIFQSEKIFIMDLTKPDPSFLQEFKGSIVAEPNLLTPLKSYPLIFEAQEMINQFKKNYNMYLREINNILPLDGVCVLIFPQIHTAENIRLPLDINQLLTKYNFKICEIQANDIKFPAFFIHSWKNPIIERQIVVFKKIR